MARQERLEQLLHELAKGPGILGAALVSRDGMSVRTTGRPELSRETFSAMSATLVGAAEIALGDLDPAKLDHVLVETHAAKLLLLGATSDLLLVVYAKRDAPLDSILERARAAAGSVAAMIAG
jgi:predicted regulator of Ras-like GTPase activity (Roadblock/LC7/MglB family)